MEYFFSGTVERVIFENASNFFRIVLMSIEDTDADFDDIELGCSGSLAKHVAAGDHVTIYANSTILGGETVIGCDSIIGGNSFITESVPAHTRVSIKSPELTLS